MSHTTLRSGYSELVERLNWFPQGAPPSDTLYKILQILFSEREAAIGGAPADQAIHCRESQPGLENGFNRNAHKVLDELIEPRHSGGR